MNVQPNFWRGVRNAIIPSLILWALIIWSVGAALAQSGGSTTRPTWFDGVTQYYVSTAHPLPISGSISASLGGFQPSASGARGTPFSVTTSDSSGNLPTGAVVAVTNVGTTNPMYCNVNGIAATTSDQYISSSGGWFAFTIPAAITTLHCIATGGSTTANTVGGSGLPTGTGGGGGASGGTSNITQVAGTAVNAGVAAAGALPVDVVPGNNLAALIANPINVFAGTAPSTQTPVSTGNPIKTQSDLNGNIYVNQNLQNTLAGGSTFVKGTTAAMTGTAATQILAAVATKVLYATRVSCKGDPANAVGTKVQITDGSAGTVLDTLTVDANGGGEQATGSTPLFWTTAGNGLFAQNVTTSASVICTASGYSG